VRDNQREVKELEANVVRIKDLDGNVRMELGCEPDGSPRLKMYDREGRPRLVVGVDDEAASVSLVSTTGEKQVELTASTDCDEAALHLNDREGIHCLTVGHEPTCDIVEVLGPGENEQIFIYAAANLGAGVWIKDSKLQQGIVLMVDEGRTSHIAMNTTPRSKLIISARPDGSMQTTAHAPWADDSEGADVGAGDGSQDGATAEASRTSSSVVDALSEATP
jgi:hypothetical protein